uniref:Uncharacterized protein n=1 Tax=Sipha flava TaxID=143950 RepID=A0A2S2QYC3_9HEMI
MLVMASSWASKTSKAEISDNCCPELEFDMWDGQFEFVGNAYDTGPSTVDDDLLELTKIPRKPPHIMSDVQKVISSRSLNTLLLLLLLFGIYFILLLLLLPIIIIVISSV